MKKKMVMLAVLCALLGGSRAFAAQVPERMLVEDAIAVYAAEYDLDDNAEKELATRLDAVRLDDGTVDVSVVRRIVRAILLEAPVHEVVENEFADMPLMEEVPEDELEEEEKKEAGEVQEKPVGATLPPVKPSKSAREGNRSETEKALLASMLEAAEDLPRQERDYMSGKPYLTYVTPEAQPGETEEEQKTRKTVRIKKETRLEPEHRVLVRPGRERGLATFAEQNFLECMAGEVMSFLPQPWNVQIPAGQQFVDIGAIASWRVNMPAVSSDHRFVAALADADSKQILVWDMVTGVSKEFFLETKNEFGPAVVAFRSEGQELVALHEKKIYRINVETLQVIEEVALDQYKKWGVFSVDGDFVVRAPRHYGAACCVVWDVATGQLVKNKRGITYIFQGSKYEIGQDGKARLVTPPLAIPGSRAGWLPDGIRVLTHESNLYQIWNTQTLEKEHEQYIDLPVGYGISCLMVSPDGRYMLCAVDIPESAQSVLRVYDLNFEWELPMDEAGEF